MSRRVIVMLVVVWLLGVQVAPASAHSDFQFELKWGTRGGQPGNFDGPQDVAVDADGYVYVTDKSNHRVQKFDSQGNVVKSWGGSSCDNGFFVAPTGLAVDDNGYLYVSDGSWCHRIQKFDSDGHFIQKFDIAFNPRDIAVDTAGNMFATRGNDSVYKFDANGDLLTYWGSTGSGDAQFSYIEGVAVSKDGLVYVADGYNCRIQVFDGDGNFLHKWGSGGWGPGEFKHPMGIAVDDSGYVYVSDKWKYTIQKFGANGAFIAEIGSFPAGSGDGEFNEPRGIAVDGGGSRLFVADTLNHRIQVFGWPRTPSSTPLIMFGGHGGQSVLADTWRYDGVEWSSLDPLSPAPAPRSRSGVVYDSRRNRVILFGGWDGSQLFNDTWEYSGGLWKELTPPNVPSPRRGPVMAYDHHRDVIVLFGGYVRPHSHCVADTASTETWEYDGQTWHLITTQDSPPRFIGGAMAYDAERQKMVLFTGWEACEYGWQNQTWEYDGSSWVRVAYGILGTVWRYQPRMAYDAVRQKIVLFGGFHHGGVVACGLDDTWEYDGIQWTRIATTETPVARCPGAMAYDPGRGKVIMFGGRDQYGNFLADTWEYDGSHWHLVGQAFPPPGRHFSSMAQAPLPNSAPSVSAGGTYAVDEGGGVVVSASGSDPDDDALTFAWDLNNDGTFETPGQSVVFSAAILDGPSTHTIAVQATDTGGLSATDQTIAEVLNVPPTVGEITAPIDPVEVNTVVNTAASFSDPGVPDTHTAVWDWGDDASTTDELVTSPLLASHTYTTPGIYTIQITVTDDDGGPGQSVFQYVVVYDPEGGFVTGGGWIDSPLEAYRPDLTLTGRANFGFVSKYKKGAATPTGQTEFQFKVADLNFHSDSYDWLVVAGARAQYKGIGTINGSGEYKFMLKALDAAINEDDAFDVDRFRIKIWEEDAYGIESVIYDNGLGADDDDDNAMTEIGGGSIVIHKAK